MEEADEPLLAVKRGRPRLHQLSPGDRQVATRSNSRGLGTGRCARIQPDLAAARESTAVNSGSDSAVATTPEGAAPLNLHPQRTIAHPPMPRSTSDPLSRRMKRWARRETAQQNHRGAAQNSCCGRSERSVGTGPEKALTATLRSPRALADGSLLVAEKPAWVVTEGAPPIPVRRERRDRSAAMVTRSERTLKPSTNAASARWMPRH